MRKKPQNDTPAGDARLERAIALSSDDLSREGIGRLNEKTLHSVLKYYVEPDKSFHEIKLGSYFADVLRDNTVYEIQTGSLRPLRKKLEAFLPDYKVTVIYPLAGVKYISWIGEGGEITKKRRSPKREGAWTLLPELFYLRGILGSPNFCLRLVFCVIHEYRLLDGWSEDGKKGSHRDNRVPEEIISAVDISSPDDYNVFIPDGLDGIFTAKALSKRTGFKGIRLSLAIKTLVSLGVAEKCGKRGNAFLFRLI